KFTDKNTDNFYKYCEKISRNLCPELEYKKPKSVASGNLWMRFNPRVLPKNSTIIYKGNNGYVDLQISKIGFKDFLGKYQRNLQTGMSIHKTGKSVVVRIISDKLLGIEKIKHPEQYKKLIIEVLKSASRLMQWYIK
ncbi:MAG TPA: hypothetical protein PL066_04125, partial [bacterium]|nr:hypothetical protein [bacterium]